MMKPLTFVCMLTAFGSGLYLYSEKHQAELLDRQIAHAIRTAQAARERTGLLRAEWALLNEPGRLQDMADRYLSLKPMAPAQFVQMADLSSRLPPPLPANAQGSTDTGDDDAAAAPAAMAAADAQPDTQAPGPAAAPDATPADPAVIADSSAADAAKPEPDSPAKPASKPAAKLVAHATPKHAAPHPLTVADRAPLHAGPLARGTMLPLASPPVRPTIVSAMAHPFHAPAAPRPMLAAPARAASATYVGSSLGGSTGSLPPPVPLAQ
jgi:hypothetical protein